MHVSNDTTSPAAESVNLLWTGGWDSTFRLLSLSLLHQRPVQPYYIITWDRPSTGAEIQTMCDIKRLLFKKHPETKSLLRPTRPGRPASKCSIRAN